jgi:hypothetical protein
MIILLRSELRGAHVHADIFVGPRLGELALAGKVVMRPEEYALYECALMRGTIETRLDVVRERVGEEP